MDTEVVCRECGIALTPNYMEGCWSHFGNKACRFEQMDHPSPAYRGPSYAGVADFAVLKEARDAKQA